MGNDSSLILSLDVGKSLRAVRSVNDLRRLLSYPAWGYVTQLLNRTRAYDSALSGAELLIKVIESYEDELTRKERDSFLQSAYTLKLQSLDKLDFWEEYKAFWNELRKSTDYEICYSSRSTQSFLQLGQDNKDGRSDNLGRESFILRLERDSVYLHWLYLSFRRYKLIDRKLERRNKGRSRKSDFHHSQLDLSEKEIRRRLLEFERILATAWNEK